ncbi:MAG: hypothetical protein WKG01_27830 [Kofleriaceae bacterium]
MMTNRLLQLSFTSLLALAPSRADAGTTSCVPGFNHALFGKDEIKMTGHSVTNSYNSATSTFTLSNSDADLGTNGSGCADITLSGGVVVNGDIQYGVDGTSCAISNNSSTITGTTGAQTQNVTLPSVTIPTVGTYHGDVSCSGRCAQPLVLASDESYGEVAISSGKGLTLQAGTYVLDGLKLTGGSSVIVGTGPILVYITCAGGGGLDLTGGNVTNSTKISTNLVFMTGPACTDVKVAGGSGASFGLYAPDADVKISGGSDIYGAVVGKSVTVTGGTGIHYDRALASFATGPFSCAAGEVSRASPVVASIAGTPYVVQGTYEYPFPTKVPLTTANVNTWTFSYIRGHMRAKPAASVTGSASGYSTSTKLFDAALKLPSITTSGCNSLSGSCRRIFTTTQSTPASGLTARPSLVTLRIRRPRRSGPDHRAPLRHVDRRPPPDDRARRPARAARRRRPLDRGRHRAQHPRGRRHHPPDHGLLRRHRWHAACRLRDDRWHHGFAVEHLSPGRVRAVGIPAAGPAAADRQPGHPHRRFGTCDGSIR